MNLSTPDSMRLGETVLTHKSSSVVAARCLENARDRPEQTWPLGFGAQRIRITTRRAVVRIE